MTRIDFEVRGQGQREIEIENLVQSKIIESLGIGSKNLEGRLVMTCRWIVLRSVGQCLCDVQ